MEESDFRELIREYAMQVRLDQGEAILTSVLKQILAENPDMKTEVRSSVAIIKEVIAEVNSLEESELSDTAAGISGDEASEYEMLVKMVTEKMGNNPDLKDQIVSLVIYGSYAKRLHVVGESDINFLIILKASKEAENAIEKISNIAEEIVTPEIAHIFDLMILKEDDIPDFKQFEPAFTHIHALYAKDGEIIKGENLFNNVSFTDKQIKDAAAVLIEDSILHIEETKKAASEEGLPEDELDYLIGASIIDIAFGLSCHKAGVKSVTMDLVKPDIHEEIVEVWGTNSKFSKYYPLLEKAHAFKLGIKLPDSDNFMNDSNAFIHDVKKYIGV